MTTTARTRSNGLLTAEVSYLTILTGLMACTAAGAVPKTPVGTNSPSSTLEEVIVTAQKQAERLQDVPVPVTAISGESLTSANQLRVEDYFETIPGLSLAPRGNGGEPQIAIRGLTTGGSSNPTVGIVIDDVSYGASVSTGPNAVSVPDIDPGDIARVEVLRGPQGTLYGASSIGGLLKFVSVDPTTDKMTGRVQMGSSSVRHGSDLGYSVRGNINIPLGETVAIRGSGFSVRDPGYIDNVETGQRDVNSRDSKGGRLSALWAPSDALTIKLSALMQDTERGGTAEIDTLLGRDSLRQSFLRDSGTYTRNSQAYSATIVGQLGAAEVTSATGYSSDESSNTLDTSLAWGAFADVFFGVDRVVTKVDRDIEKFSQELRVSLPLGERLNWLVGGFYTDEKIKLTADNLAATDDGRTVGSIYNNAYGYRDPRGAATFEEYAFFTNLTVEFTEYFDVQFGSRYSENSQTTPTYWTGPAATVFFGQDPFFNSASENSDTAVTYLMTPRFKITPELMVYARLASGYRPGGVNVACGRAGVPCSYQEDTTENYDLGAKGTLFDGALTFDASLYYIDWENIQIAELFTLDGFIFTDNVSKAASKGAELSITLKPTAGLSLSGWAAYNDAELNGSFSSVLVAGNRGDRLPYGSRISGSVSVDWEFPLRAADGRLGATMSYIGKREGRFQQAGIGRETYPGYGQVDLHAGATIDTWELGLFVNNALDKRGILRSGVDYFNTPNFLLYTQPRTIGMSLSKAF